MPRAAASVVVVVVLLLLLEVVAVVVVVLVVEVVVVVLLLLLEVVVVVPHLERLAAARTAAPMGGPPGASGGGASASAPTTGTVAKTTAMPPASHNAPGRGGVVAPFARSAVAAAFVLQAYAALRAAEHGLGIRLAYVALAALRCAAYGAAAAGRLGDAAKSLGFAAVLDLLLDQLSETCAKSLDVKDAGVPAAASALASGAFKALTALVSPLRVSAAATLPQTATAEVRGAFADALRALGGQQDAPPTSPALDAACRAVFNAGKGATPYTALVRPVLDKVLGMLYEDPVQRAAIRTVVKALGA